MPVSRHAFVDLAAFSAVLAIAVVGGWWIPDLLPKSDIQVTADAACDLNLGACATALPDGGSLEVEISPRPVPLVRNIAIAVRGPAAGRRVWADFAGVGMNMGENRPELVRGADGIWRGETALPVCITGAMPWDLTLIVESPGKRLHLTHRFATHAHPPPEIS